LEPTEEYRNIVIRSTEISYFFNFISRLLWPDSVTQGKIIISQEGKRSPGYLD